MESVTNRTAILRRRCSGSELEIYQGRLESSYDVKINVIRKYITSSFFYSITVIDPVGHRRDRYTALKNGFGILRKHHASVETAVAPAPYTSPIRIDPLVLLL